MEHNLTQPGYTESLVECLSRRGPLTIDTDRSGILEKFQQGAAIGTTYFSSVGHGGCFWRLLHDAGQSGGLPKIQCY